jgi:hypothetical protein
MTTEERDEGIGLRYYRVDHRTVTGGLVVRYRHTGRLDFEVSASRDGVLVSGHSPAMNGSAVIALGSVLEAAGRQSRAMNAGGDPHPFSGDPHCVRELRRARLMETDEVVERREP